MRALSPALAAHLDSGATTLCTCWKVVRRDGMVLCFTDHDRDIGFDALTFSAATGVEGASSEAALGLAASGSEMSGALMASSLSEADLSEGLFDGAKIEIWRVNWTDSAQRILLESFCFGEVRRSGETFTVELRSVSTVFDQEAGRLYQQPCDAALGDIRCGVDMNDPQHSRTVSVTGCVGGLETTFASAAFADGALNGGKAEILGGPYAGYIREIESHRNADGSNWIRFWRALPGDVAAGIEMRVSVGCNKSFAACRDTFANSARFRGFPHMPGNDALLANASSSSTKMDGGSLFK